MEKMKGVGGYSYVKERRPCDCDCVRWVENYMKDCLCNLRDELSFGFGMVSLVAWAVAEIPQIVTNFRSKSSHGVSILFLLTWVLGDLFNLAGCLLEPATLPTQYYTALLYTISTLVLLFQSIYYDHFYNWCCPRNLSKTTTTLTHQDDDDKEEQKRALNPKDEADDDQGGIPIPSRPLPSRPHSARRGPDIYYFTSARSLAGSSTPPFRSYLRAAAKSGPSAVVLVQEDHSSSEDENDVDATPSIPPVTITNRAAAKPVPIPIPRAGKRGVIVAAASVSLPIQGNALATVYTGLTGRKLLQEGHIEHNAFGQWLGWMMAAIYMGGRIPQIILNIKRGSVEGLNPLMFIFALVANAAYVASILVRSTEWKKIKANMPWLLDAVVCVALDLFIILQYVYYKYIQRKQSFDEDDDPKGRYNYMEAEPKDSSS